VVDKDVFLKVLEKRVNSLPVGHYLDIRTYKRNRKVYVVKLSEEEYKVLEDGYYQKEYEVKGIKELKKLFKKLLKVEFPRSHKIRVYTMGVYDPEKVKNTKFKEL